MRIGLGGVTGRTVPAGNTASPSVRLVLCVCLGRCLGLELLEFRFGLEFLLEFGLLLQFLLEFGRGQGDHEP